MWYVVILVRNKFILTMVVLKGRGMYIKRQNPKFVFCPSRWWWRRWWWWWWRHTPKIATEDIAIAKSSVAKSSGYIIIIIIIMEIMIMLMKIVMILMILSMIFCIFLHCLLWSGLGVDDFAVFHILFSNDSHFHLFSLLIRNPHYLSLKLAVRKWQYSLLTGDGPKSYRWF